MAPGQAKSEGGRKADMTHESSPENHRNAPFGSDKLTSEMQEAAVISWSQTFAELHASVVGEAAAFGQDNKPQSKNISLLSKVVEGQVIPRLVLAQKEISGQVSKPNEAGLPEIQADMVEPFVTLLISGQIADLDHFVTDLVQQGFSVQAIYLDLFARAARQLGIFWEEDKYSFADVTIGLGRLQALFHRLSAQHARGKELSGPAPRALFLTPEGAMHSFGVRVAEDLFRQAGWSTLCELNVDIATLRYRLSSEAFDLIGISVAVQEHLEQVRELIEEIRKSKTKPTPKIVLSGPIIISNPSLVQELGADFIARDGTEAIVLATELGYGR